MNPITAVVEGGRGFISAGDASVLLAYAAAFGLASVFLAWAVRGLRKAEAAGG